MTTARTVMLQGAPHRMGSPQRALLLIEGGLPAGGYLAGKAIDAAQAAALLESREWSLTPAGARP